MWSTSECYQTRTHSNDNKDGKSRPVRSCHISE